MDPERRRKFWLGAGLVALTVVAFFPILFNGFIWDDDNHIVLNQNLRMWGGLMRIWSDPNSMPQFYPLYHSVLWAAYRVWGAAPLGYHLLSMGLQGLNAVLLWRLLERLEIKGAWFAAALFAVHPIQTETVAWAMEIKSILSAMFYFLALGTLLPCWGLGGDGETAAQWRKRYGRGMLLFLMSLLCKSVTATMPAVILLLVWWKRGRIAWREIVWALPLMSVGVISGLYTAAVEKSRDGASGPDFQWNFIERLLIASRSLCMYVGDLLWPRGLNFFYYRWPVDAADWRQYVWLVVLGVVFGGLWLGRRWWGRGPLAGGLFFAGTLFPALGFANVYPMRFSFVADHFQYLACIGIFVLAGGAGLWAMRISARGRQRAVILGLGGSLLIALAALSFERCFVYKNSTVLYESIVAADWRVWVAQNLLATDYFEQGKYRESVEHSACALWLKPGDLDCREMVAESLGAVGQEEMGAEVMGLGPGPEVREKTLVFLERLFEKLGRHDVADAVHEDLRSGQLPGPHWRGSRFE